MKTIIKPNEHVFIPGRTGSGKTYLAESYLAGYDNVICLDTKHTENWRQIPDVALYTHFEELQYFGEGKAIYRPTYDEMNPYFYEEFFKWIFERKNTIVWIDEVMSICQNSSTIPEHYRACLTMGRELNIGCWSLTQRPKTIPLVTMSEATHFFIFDLNLLADRKRLVEVSGTEEFLIQPSEIGGDHSFWYYNYRMNNPQLGKLV